LVYGLKERKGLEIIEAVPSKLARLLDESEIDCGIIPSIEYFRQAAAWPATDGISGLKIIPDISIAALGEVWSIRLFAKKALAEVESVALDEASRTSAALTKIIFKERFGKEPQWKSLEPKTNLEGLKADAALLIGDPAMQREPAGLRVYDLGKLWQEMTGLAFVYALWVARSRRARSSLTGPVRTDYEMFFGALPAILSEARARGLAHLSEITKTESKRLGLPEALCYEYLTKIMRYDLGEEELSGLKKFYEYAVKLGLAPEGVEIKFFGNG